MRGENRVDRKEMVIAEQARKSRKNIVNANQLAIDVCFIKKSAYWR